MPRPGFTLAGGDLSEVSRRFELFNLGLRRPERGKTSAERMRQDFSCLHLSNNKVTQS